MYEIEKPTPLLINEGINLLLGENQMYEIEKPTPLLINEKDKFAPRRE